jgi:hypothetical protein
MKQKPLMDDELAALVAYRIQRAKDTLKETDILFTKDITMRQSTGFIMPVITL